VEGESVMDTVEQVNTLSIRENITGTAMEQDDSNSTLKNSENGTEKDGSPNKKLATPSKTDSEIKVEDSGESKHSFWSSAFGMKSVFEALASPFKFRKL
jgi:hypothetical protein